MIGFRGSPSVTQSEDCVRAARSPGQDNVAWFSEQVQRLRRPRADDSFVLLLGGGQSVYDFRLRVAQSHLRADLTPSHWSHAALVTSGTIKGLSARSGILEVALDPHEGFQVPTMHNGIQAAPLSRYADPRAYPNVAVIRVPVPRSAWLRGRAEQKSVLEQFAHQRAILDVPSLLLEWLGFVWGAGDAGNPLLQGHGVPSAAVIESLLGAAGYDLSPGLDTSATSPEAFWQAAKWWQAYYVDMGIETMATRYATAESMLDADPAPAAAPASKALFGAS